MHSLERGLIKEFSNVLLSLPKRYNSLLVLKGQIHNPYKKFLKGNCVRLALQTFRIYQGERKKIPGKTDK